MRVKMFAKMQRLPIKYFDTHTHGDVMSSYTNDIDAIRQLISQSLPQACSTLITMTSLVFVMMYLSVILFVVVVVGLFAITMGNSRRATWVGPQAERPRFPGPPLRRTRGPDPSSKATLWVKAQHEGALPPPCIVRNDPRVPHTARRGACDPLSNSRVQRASLPQTRRGLTLLSQLCRNPAVGV